MFRRITALKLAFVMSLMLCVVPEPGCDRSILSSGHEVAATAVDIVGVISAALPPGDAGLPQLQEWKARCIAFDAQLNSWDGVDAKPLILALGAIAAGFETLIMPSLGNDVNLRTLAAIADGALRYLARKFKQKAAQLAASSGQSNNGSSSRSATILADEDVQASVALIDSYLKTAPIKKP